MRSIKGNLADVIAHANISTVESMDPETKQTPIHIATIKGDPKIIEKLIDVSVKYIDAPDRHGRTPFYFAAAVPNVSVVNFLLLNKTVLPAKAQCNCCNTTALERAAELGHMSTVQSLLTGRGMGRVNRDSAIALAKRNGHVKVHSFLNYFDGVV